MQSVTAGEGRRARAHTGPAPRRQRQRAARLLCPSALTQHALPGPELSRSCSPRVRAAGRNRKFGTVLVVGPGVLNGRPFARLCRSLPPPPPSGGLPWGPFRGLARTPKIQMCLGGHSRRTPRVPFAVASPGFRDRSQWVVLILACHLANPFTVVQTGPLCRGAGSLLIALYSQPGTSHSQLTRSF